MPTNSQREFKNMHDRVGIVIYWELCKQLGFDHVNKWYEHKPEALLENRKRLKYTGTTKMIVVNKGNKICQTINVAMKHQTFVYMNRQM